MILILILHLLNRSICDYAVPVFNSSLPNYLINDFERVQKRALSIICPRLSYNESLAFLAMDSIFDHHSFFMQFTFYWVAVGEPSHKMRTGLSPTSKNV